MGGGSVRVRVCVCVCPIPAGFGTPAQHVLPARCGATPEPGPPPSHVPCGSPQALCVWVPPIPCTDGDGKHPLPSMYGS